LLLTRLLLRLLLHLLLLLPLLPFFLRDVMTDCAPGRRAHDAVMTGHMACYSAYRSALDAAFCMRCVRSGQQHRAQ